MAGYKRITKRTKLSKNSVLTDPGPFFVEWVQENQHTIFFAVTSFFIAVLVGYGVFYYANVFQIDARNSLNEAVSIARSGGGQNALIKYVESSGGGNLSALARVELGGIFNQIGEYEKAAEQYGKAALESNKGSVLREVAIMGESFALLMTGKAHESIEGFGKLAKNGQFFPKQQARIELAYALVSIGKDEDAVKELQAMGSSETKELPLIGIDHTVRRISDGEIKKILTKLDSDKNNPSKVHDEQK